MAVHHVVGPMDLEQSMMLQRLGRFDPTAEQSPGAFKKTFYVSGERVTVDVRHHEETLSIDAPPPVSWPFAIRDGYETFVPEHPHLRKLHVASRMRIFDVPWRFDVAIGCVLQQRVRFEDACAGWRRIVTEYGEGQALPPAAELSRFAPWRFEKLGIDARRARAILALAREEAFSHFLSHETPRDKVIARLGKIVGIGPWTMGMLLGFGFGDTDAIITGDLHLPRLVCECLGPEGPVSEERMLSLLEPYAGQRFRVARLLMSRALRGRIP